MAIPLIPTTVTLNVAPTFSPATTCFPTTVASTYTLSPEGPDSLVDDRLVIRQFQTLCYPPSMLSLGVTSFSTITIDSTEIRTFPLPTASYFSATTCPPGFTSAGGQGDGTTSHVHCCPSGGFTVQPVDIGTYSGCIQTPTAPVTLLNGTATMTLATPTDEPYGISYRPLEIVFMNNQTVSSMSSSSDQSSNSTSSGLSSGAQAGIGVAVALIVIAAVVIAGLLWWRKRKRSSDQREDLNKAERGSEITEVPGEDRAIHEMGFGDVHETDVKRNSAYIDPEKTQTPQAPVELPADSALYEAPVTEQPSELPSPSEKT